MMIKRDLLSLSADELDIVCHILWAHIPDRVVWVFGSRANGRAKPFSDLDLAIMGDEALDVAVVADLKEAFQLSLLPFKVDLLDWATTSRSFRQVVMMSGYYVLV